MILKIITLLLTYLALWPSLSYAVPRSETLQYDLTLAGVSIGSASLSTVKNGTTLEIRSTLTSGNAVTPFYRVDDSLVSTMRIFPPSYVS